MSKDKEEQQNVQVVGRFRPFNRREKELGIEESHGLFSTTDTTVTVNKKDDKGNDIVFGMTRVFNMESTQEDLYENVAAHAMRELFNGYNSTIFAYGQTGSGKSWTMFGDRENLALRGLVPRCSEQIFQTILTGKGGGAEFTISCSYVEVYQEKLQDLLKPENEDLQIREDNVRGVYVAGLSHEYVGSVADIYKLIAMGDASKKRCATKMNPNSSRSHCCFSLELEISSPNGKKSQSALNLIDLAGSERIAKTGASGLSLEQAKKINLSLTTLARVIQALAEKQRVPYRESVLTRLLQNSLGGNSKTCMMVGLSPHLDNLDETITTLRFAQSCARIQNTIKKNTVLSAAELQAMLEAAKRELAQMQNGGRPVVEMNDDVCQTQEGENEELWNYDDSAKEEKIKNEVDSSAAIYLEQVQTEKDAHEMTKKKLESKQLEIDSANERSEYLQTKVNELEQQLESHKESQQKLVIQQSTIESLERKVIALEKESLGYKEELQDIQRKVEDYNLEESHLRARQDLERKRSQMLMSEPGSMRAGSGSGKLPSFSEDEEEGSQIKQAIEQPRQKKKSIFAWKSNESSTGTLPALPEGQGVNANIATGTSGGPPGGVRKKSSFWGGNKQQPPKVSDEQIDKLKQEIQSLTAENEELRVTISQHDLEVHNFKAEIEGYEQKTKDLQRIIDLTEASKKMFEKKCKNSEEMLEMMEQAKEAAERHADQQTSLVVQLQQSETKYEKIIAAIEDEKSELEEKLVAFERRTGDLEMELIKAREVRELKESSSTETASGIRIRVPVMEGSILQADRAMEGVNNLIGLFSFGGGGSKEPGKEGEESKGVGGAAAESVTKLMGSLNPMSLMGGKQTDGQESSSTPINLKFW
eukprot:c21739_g7_i2.p1 GENE.c21739_g7_i2~~c21739_g7_i2.p1  ORF type:complete len:874 (+),score=447.06 c21739_g7_i2:188-2809(+)